MLFDPAKLARLKDALKKRDVLVFDNDTEAYLDSLGADALYTATFTGEIHITLRPNPTRIAVVEELIHYAQHRRFGLDPEGTNEFNARHLELEVEAQERMLEIAEAKGWTEEEKAQISEAHQYWASRIAERS